jgi:hypothetical protein
MMGFVTIALAILFLAILLRWILWPPTGNTNGPVHSGPVEFPSRIAGERICSKDDLRFVEQHTPELRSKYLRERRMLMLLWLRNLRQAVAESVRNYRVAVRTESSLKPAVELRLASEYFSFMVVWEIANFLVWTTNPVTAQFITSRVISIGEQVSLAAGLLSSEGPSLSRSSTRQA